MTPMRTMIVPPPWSAYQLPLPASAAQVVSPASPAEDTGNVGVLTHDNQFLVFCHNSKGEGGLLRLRKVGNMGVGELTRGTNLLSHFIFTVISSLCLSFCANVLTRIRIMWLCNDHVHLAGCTQSMANTSNTSVLEFSLVAFKVRPLRLCMMITSDELYLFMPFMLDLTDF